MVKHILVVDDHPLVRMVLKKIVSRLPFTSQIYEAAGFDGALEELQNQAMDLILLDLSIPGGQNAEMLLRFRAIQDNVPILIFSGRDEWTHAPFYVNKGANGFLSKRANDAEILLAINTVMNGQRYLKKDIKQLILTTMMENRNFTFNPIDNLTQRENEVMKLLLEGLSVKETAARLGLKISTVSTHKIRICEKLNVNNLMELSKVVGLYQDELSVTAR